MAVTYKKLFHLLIDKGMTNAEPMEQAGFSANMITRIKHDNYISLDSIEKTRLKRHGATSLPNRKKS